MKERILISSLELPQHSLAVASAIAITYKSNVTLKERRNDASERALRSIIDQKVFIEVDSIFNDSDVEILINYIDSAIRAVMMPDKGSRFNAVLHWSPDWRYPQLFLEHRWDD